MGTRSRLHQWVCAYIRHGTVIVGVIVVVVVVVVVAVGSCGGGYCGGCGCHRVYHWGR